jgi:phytanoyl-CoA hydroxylase
MKAAAKAAGFRAPLLLQSMYICKSPGVGGEVVCHQDQTYLYTEPDLCVGFWLAIDRATIDNGCMEFIPCRRDEPLRKRFRRTEGGAETILLDPAPFDETRRVAVEADIGDLVIFHGRAPHLSRANRSDRPRHAYTLHLIEASARYPADNWLRRALPARGFD